MGGDGDAQNRGTLNSIDDDNYLQFDAAKESKNFAALATSFVSQDEEKQIEEKPIKKTLKGGQTDLDEHGLAVLDEIRAKRKKDREKRQAQGKRGSTTDQKF